MWVFISFIFLFPASARSSSTCPKPVTAPEALVATLGSCLYIPCRYDLCQAGPSPHPPLLRWLHHPHYDPQQQKFWGRAVEEHRGTTGSPQGDCSLTIPRVYPESAGVYGLRLMANASRRYYKDLRWMHPVTVNVTGRNPHLGVNPSPPSPTHTIPPSPTPTLSPPSVSSLGRTGVNSCVPPSPPFPPPLTPHYPPSSSPHPHPPYSPPPLPPHPFPPPH
ncbi:E3 ubiquitin-protein ligase Hakai-like [Falco rusticolus]|uniref:E3 ubiquitin-protein ligase Hakai-like n=1 Tax=Falco rusticolus TaxID=120794 RepID=UPI001886AACC|nr:E3 ubiquitin-protein ligase Hakai-like [Falco rusticolus]